MSQNILMCPNCKTRYKWDESYKGTVVTCPSCGKPFASDSNTFSMESTPPQAPAPASPDMIEAKCTTCGYSANVPSSLSGKKVKCPKCQGVFTVGDLGGFEVVDSTPQSPAATVHPVKIHFAKDLAAAFGVTVTYYEPFEKDGKKLARKKELKSKLGETVKFTVNVPSIVIFEVGFGNGGGKFTAEPGCKYIARKGGLLGTKWQVSEVDQITTTGQFAGQSMLFAEI